MCEENHKPTVVVTGDVCYDWNIATTRPSSLHNLWKSDEDWGSVSPVPGASWLLAELIQQTAKKSGEQYLVKPSPEAFEEDPTLKENIDHLLSLWNGFPVSGPKTVSDCRKLLKSKSDADTAPCDPSPKKEKVWRIQQFLGWQKKSNLLNVPTYDKHQNISKHRLLVIDDKRFGFRDSTSKKNWPDFYKADWIITRMARDLCKGELWKKLMEPKPENHEGKAIKDKLIVVVTATDLRHMDVRIRKELSWETTAQDVLGAMEKMEKMKDTGALLQCKHVIVSFDAAGAVLYTKTDGGGSWRLIYDPALMEGFTRKNDQGSVQGYAYCLIAAVVNNMLHQTNESKIDDDEKRIKIIIKGVMSGINAMKKLYDNGYDHIEKSVTINENGEDNKVKLFEFIKFPHATIAEVIAEYDHDCKEYYEVLLPDNSNGFENWSIAMDVLTKGDFQKKLAEIILNGPNSDIMNGVPVIRLGDKKDICIVDRKEIEELRSISNLVEEYYRKAKSKHSAPPLSIAVFGAPGSGKSFLVKNIAQSIGLKEKLEFNLSQFDSIEDLTGAFHQVRDKCLERDIPLVFFDEFDCNFKEKLGWLKYFLMPMQDGKFQDKQQTHLLGQCILVFAGGTCNDFNELKKNKDIPEVKDSKVSDFISRLKGHVSIKGINLQNKCPQLFSSADVNIVKIKRALLLHSYLKRHADDIMIRNDEEKIQREIINAFLNTEIFEHGARSMESIILMSRLDGEAEFRTSALPPKELLDLHVDGQEFLRKAGIGE